MPIKKFQIFSKYVSLFFKLLAVLFLILLIFGSLNIFIRQNFLTFSLDNSRMLSISYSSVPITLQDCEWAISIVLPIALAALGYISFKASYLFDFLADGKTPFAYEFIHSLKVIGFLLVLFDLATSLLYTFFVNFTIQQGLFFYFSLSAFFFIGLLLFLISLIINYGLDLQQSMDESIN